MFVTAGDEPFQMHKTRFYSTIWNGSFEHGIMLPNKSGKGKELAQSVNYLGLDLHLGLCKNDLNDIYNKLYRYPAMGLGIYASTFQRSAIGNPYAIYFFFDIPVNLRHSQKWTFAYSGAFGLAFNFNPYDEVENPANIFLGTANNSYIDFKFKLNYHLTPKWTPSLSVGFKHFSNGGVHLPNLGVNLLLLSAGLAYNPSGFMPGENRSEIPDFIRHNQFNIAVLIGTKNYEAGEPSYLKTALELNWLRALSYKHRLGLGFDVYYNSNAGKIQSPGPTFNNTVSLGIFASYEWAITRRFYIPIGLGVYLKRNEANGERQPYYERIGIRYRFDNNLFAGVTIKAHREVADFIEWTVGYTLKKDKNSY